MRIGLYFGSFNPIHNGHLIIAKHVLNNTDLKQVWLIVSPHNPLKKSSQLLNEYHRLHLTQQRFGVLPFVNITKTITPHNDREIII